MRPRPTQFHTGENGGAVRELAEPAPRTPRMEKGTKVVLPDGQVRLIVRTEFDFDDSGSPKGIKLIFSDRWSPR